MRHSRLGDSGRTEHLRAIEYSCALQAEHGLVWHVWRCGPRPPDFANLIELEHSKGPLLAWRSACPLRFVCSLSS